MAETRKLAALAHLGRLSEAQAAVQMRSIRTTRTRFCAVGFTRKSCVASKTQSNPNLHERRLAWINEHAAYRICRV